MRKVTRFVIAALFLQFFVGGVPAEAAPTPLRIVGVFVSETNVTVKWTAPKLTSKDYFEVEFTKAGSKPKFVKTKNTAIIAKLDAFSTYTVRIRKYLSPKIWSPIRTLKTSSNNVEGFAVSNITYTSADLVWNPVVGATAYDVILNDSTFVSVLTTKYTLIGLKPGSSLSLIHI